MYNNVSYLCQALGAGAVAPASGAALIRNWHRGGAFYARSEAIAFSSKGMDIRQQCWCWSDVEWTNDWLVVWLPWIWHFPINIGLLIIPIDELLFFRGVAQPPTRNCWYFSIFFSIEHGDQKMAVSGFILGWDDSYSDSGRMQLPQKIQHPTSRKVA